MERFRCRVCSYDEENASAPHSCPECGSRSYTLTFSKGSKFKGKFCNIDGTMKENLRYSDALGINPNQTLEFRKHFPWMNFDDEGRCIIHNRAEKKRVMKARGFDERK